MFLFDRKGSFVASGRAPLDYQALAPGDESPFVITVPGAADVSRYRVSFREGDDVLPHVDRREAARRAAAAGRHTLKRGVRPMQRSIDFRSSARSSRSCWAGRCSSRSSPPPPQPQDREEERGQQAAGDGQSEEGFRFRTGVELINVSATVTDASGRFVPNLRKEDFVVYEDGKEQTITHFNAERVPVSLGIVLDTSGSMAGEKFEHAQAALDRFLFDLLDANDEVFLVRFSTDAYLEQGWTTDKGRISRALAAHHAARRDGDVRRRRRGRAAGRSGAPIARRRCW